MKSYEHMEYCKSINCPALKHSETHVRIGLYCEDCKAFQFHSYLRANNQTIEPGSDLARLVEALLERKSTLQEYPGCNELALDASCFIKPIYDAHYKVKDLDRQIDEILSRLEESK